MKPARVPDPIIPANEKDRTGTAGILRRVYAEIRKRYAGLQTEVLAVFGRIPVYSSHDAAAPAERTLYGMTPDEMAATSFALQQALDRWIAGGSSPYTHWYADYDREASQLGVAQTSANLSRLSPAYAASRTLQQIIFSQPYRNRVAMAQIKSYDHWTGLAAETRATLSQIIGRAVVDGKNPKAVASEISQALDVSKSRALGYAQTDVTDALRQARWAESDQAQEDLGLNTALLWTSALLATTRATHAARHGKTYTSDETRAFYSKDGNTYRCHCSQTEALLDDDDNPILSQGLKDSMSKEKATWQKRYGR